MGANFCHVMKCKMLWADLVTKCWQVIPWFGFLQEISFFGNILVFLKKIDDSSLQNLQEIKLFGNVLVFLKIMNDSSTQNLSAAFFMSEADMKVSKIHRYHEISSRPSQRTFD